MTQSKTHWKPVLEKITQGHKIGFGAMASPCEILVNSHNQSLVTRLAELALQITRDFEAKYSRYQAGNLCWQMNQSHGRAIAIDQETYQLLNYAKQLFELSQGLFDMTSGILRKAWQFHPDAPFPQPETIQPLLTQIGFDRLKFDQRSFFMPKGMEIDFGGIGKEYCVDKVVASLLPDCQKQNASFLVNFGGDLCARQLGKDLEPWLVGLEHVEHTDQACQLIEVSQGAIATSGSTKRFIEHQGVRYAHILNPKTGYPVQGAPRSVSVFAQSCSLAGGMATLAQLQGAEAESFLKENGVKYLCVW